MKDIEESEKEINLLEPGALGLVLGNCQLFNFSKKKSSTVLIQFCYIVLS